MKISSSQPFQIIYSIFEHEYLGYLVESYVVHVDDKDRLTLQHQNISSRNAAEFKSGLDEVDFELIKLTDSIHQDAIVNKFAPTKMKTTEFFLKFYDKEKGNKLLIQEIGQYIERKRAEIFKRMFGKRLFEMGRDGEPTWKEIEVQDNKATVLFHFRKNEDNTHYFPTIKHNGQKIEFQYRGAYLVCREPAWMILEGKLYGFEKNVDGNKLAPFLNKKFIVIPKKLEETYYQKFVAPLVANYDVYAKGFDIKVEKFDPQPVIQMAPSQVVSPTMNLFGNGSRKNSENGNGEPSKMLMELRFKYGQYNLRNGHNSHVNVKIEKEDDQYVFHKLYRDLNKEKYFYNLLKKWDLDLSQSKTLIAETKAFSWLNKHRNDLLSAGFILEQSSTKAKKYFMGESTMSIEIEENIDWFDINAVIKFGQYEIPFKELRKKILKNIYEIQLPNGEIGIIPESWIEQYHELFHFAVTEDQKSPILKKHHVSLVQGLKSGELAKVTMARKLEKLKDFEKIDEASKPKGFKGKLRPYQKAGYNWLLFLNQYRFGGCLADDMGLGKTVQTLAMLQAEKEKGSEGASLLIMPTSLIYNWEVEASKFTPELKVLVYSGTNRSKDVSKFRKYDIVLTSYGITRLDVDILKEYYFNYIILDESQVIKNPQSNIAQAVKDLKSKNKLILTGTPLENTTMDLWSQMNFINPGLLGSQSFFQKEFIKPIEKEHNEDKIKRLFSLIHPFILRRNKSQVLKDLPEKIENTHYCSMSREQEERYNEVKESYRNQILEEIDSKGLNKSHLLILKGLTELRQLANHPEMVDKEYTGESGKTEDAYEMIVSTAAENHKILVFSQFVKHLTIFRRLLNEAGIKYAYLDGSTKNREHQVDLFQNDDSYKVFLISLKAGGLGLNLTSAEYVFLLDPWWNPAIEAQAIDRAHRIGQKNKVMIYKFITKNTVEEKILKLQQKKLNLARNLIHTEEGFMKSLSPDDISNILE